MSKGDDPFDLAKSYIREKTKRLQMAREWLKNIDPTLFFKDVEENEDN
jgi:hypothetical protein